MSEQNRRRRNDPTDFSVMMDEILGALEHIRSHMPNGELKVIQEKVEDIQESQEKLKDDLSTVKKLLLDPENGVIVRVNKNTQFREDHEKTLREKFETLNEIYKWKDGVNKALWVIFSAIVSIIFALLFKG